jgi:hypothetical protein
LGGSTGALTDGGARPNHFDALQIGNANTGEPGFRASLFSKTKHMAKRQIFVPYSPQVLTIRSTREINMLRDLPCSDIDIAQIHNRKK